MEKIIPTAQKSRIRMNPGGRNNPYSTKEQDRDEFGRLISLTITWAFARFNICADPLPGIGFEVFFWYVHCRTRSVLSKKTKIRYNICTIFMIVVSSI